MMRSCLYKNLKVKMRLYVCCFSCLVFLSISFSWDLLSIGFRQEVDNPSSQKQPACVIIVEVL